MDEVLSGKSSCERIFGLLTLSLKPSHNLPELQSYELSLEELTACIKLVDITPGEAGRRVPGSGSHFTRHGKVPQLLKASAGDRPQVARTHASPAPLPRPGEMLWLSVVISRAMCHRLRRSLGGMEANGAMWCLGTGCRWGAAVGTGPSCHCLPAPGRMGSISGSSDSRWVASALPPASASLRTTQRVEKGTAPLGESTPCRRASLSSLHVSGSTRS